MRKIFMVAFVLCAIVLCNTLNGLSIGAVDVATDDPTDTFAKINEIYATPNIPEDGLDTDDPYVLSALTGLGGDPAANLSKNLPLNSITASAQQSDFLGGSFVITDWGVSLQGTVLNKIIDKATYKPNTVTITPGTGKDIQADLTAINNLLSNTKVQVSFLAVRLSDGATVGYNVDEYYQSCSTIKAPLALYVSKLIDENKLDWTSPVTYLPDDYISGTGIIKNYNYGQRFKVKTLVELSIKESDNIAHKMLARAVGMQGMYNMLEKMNVTMPSDELSYWPQSNARGMALYWNEIFSFSQSGSTGKWLWDNFGTAYSKINTALGNEVKVFGKTGSSTTCSHEGAVVMGDSPYILVLLTRSNYGANTDGYFYNLVREIDKIITA